MVTVFACVAVFITTTLLCRAAFVDQLHDLKSRLAESLRDRDEWKRMADRQYATIERLRGRVSRDPKHWGNN